jgi:hypothetical protein
MGRWEVWSERLERVGAAVGAGEAELMRRAVVAMGKAGRAKGRK